jgi:parallel beta-helix repeat protein
MLLGPVLTGCNDGSSQIPVITLAPPTSQTGPTDPSPAGTVVPSGGDDELDGIVVAPGDDLAALVDAAEPGTSFVIEAGVHRMQSVRPKDGMSFVGLPGAVMNGSMVLDGFVFDDPFWRLDGIEMSDFLHGECFAGYEGCRYQQDLFMDNVMLWQVTEIDQLEPGRWLWDGESVFVANDPSQRRVELSVAEYAFLGAASDVTISGLRIEKYATPAQSGTVQAQEPGDGERGQRWLIEDIEITGSHGAGIRTGDFTTVRNVYVHDNGQMGVSISGGTGVVLEGSEIAFNNIAGFDWGWEGGGMKATLTQDLIVRNNHSHDNEGPGLWTDIDAVDTLYEGNVVADNAGVGIFHEISGAATIRDNTVERNGFGKSEWLWGAGILVAASSDVEVYDNRVLDNADGIAGIQQERGSGPDGPRLLRNLSVYDNTVRMLGGQTGVVQDVGDDAVFTSRGIVFSGNTYVDVIGRRFAWDGRSLDQDGWLATGQDEGSEWQSS